MRAPDRQRFLNAVRHVEQDEIPLFEIEADIAIAQQMLGKKLDMSKHSFELPIEDIVAWNEWFGNDMIYFGQVCHLGRREKTDADGRIHYIDGRMKTRDSLKDAAFPDLDRLKQRLAQLFEAIAGTNFGVVCAVEVAGTGVATAVGYEDFCINTLTNPGFILDFQKIWHDYAMRQLDMFLEFPIDAVKVGSGLITNMGTMLAPDQMEIFDFQYMREIIRTAKAHGKAAILHVDGNVTASIPTFLEMGVDILNPIEPAGGTQDIYRIKEEYGDRLTLCGNIDVDGVLFRGTPDQVKRDVLEHIERLAPGGGYIVSSSHDLHQLIPLDNIKAMRDAVHATSIWIGK